MNREYRILFTSFSATVITAAVLSGLAISVLPECALRPGMRVLGEADGFGAAARLQDRHHARPYRPGRKSSRRIARHISDSLDNISVPMAEETGSFDFAAMASVRGRKPRPSHILPGW